MTCYKGTLKCLILPHVLSRYGLHLLMMQRVPNPNVAVAATQMEILTMATKKKSSKKKQSAITKTIVKKTTARKPRPVVKTTATKPRSKAVADPKTQRPKTKKHRVEGAIGALDEVLTGLGAERAERIRQRVRAVLNSFR